MPTQSATGSPRQRPRSSSPPRASRRPAGRSARIPRTILGPHDYVVIARSRRQPGSLHAAGAWNVAGIAENAAVAETMANVLMSAEPRKEARAVSHAALFHKIDGRDRERIVELLDGRTTADIARGDALREAAHAWLDAADAPLSRSGSSDAHEESRPPSAKPRSQKS